MNIKRIFGIKADAETKPAIREMVSRVSTLEGCRQLANELANELAQQLEMSSGFSPKARLVRRQLEEVNRLLLGLEIAEDRRRAAAVIKRDMDEATKNLKAAEARLVEASDAASQARQVLAGRSMLITSLQQQLAEIHTAADEAVQEARNAFDAAVSAGDQVAESAAFDEYKRAKVYRDTCGESLIARITAHETERDRLMREQDVANREESEALAAVSHARQVLARIEYDQAAQQMIDAYVKVQGLARADASGRVHQLSSIHNMDLTIADPERVALGRRLVAESGRVNDRVLAEMIKTVPPADLDLLARDVSKESEADAATEQSGDSDAADVERSISASA